MCRDGHIDEESMINKKIRKKIRKMINKMINKKDEQKDEDTSRKYTSGPAIDEPRRFTK